MIVVGGANEAILARPGINELVIKKRLGFIKLALRTGSPLVPVFSFGENDLWDQLPNPEGSKIRKFQDIFRKYTTMSPPALFGRGIFTYNFGFLPYRRSIISVVGKPIDVPILPNPTEEEIAFYQKQYLDELQRVYDKYKNEYLPDRKEELIFKE
jgi:2-acylglycerol O-acyltransferase 2